MLAMCCNGVDIAFNNTEQLGPQRARGALEETDNEQKSTSDGKEGYEKTKPAETVWLPVSEVASGVHASAFSPSCVVPPAPSLDWTWDLLLMTRKGRVMGWHFQD